ncbi:MAG: hypothetical protein AB7P50_08170 [Alphaproteobacteria bacterium]
MNKPASGTKQAFRFFDNREKYLLFVTTCSEKWAVAKRVGQELQHLTPRQPALNVFDAGMGDGTVLTRVLRDLHRRNPTVPFVIVGKEISLEDVRLSLEKMSDRFHEHPQTVLVVTNLYYSEAPHLRPAKPEAAARVNRWEIALKGNTAHEFDEQIRELQPLLNEGWQTRASEKTGNPMYVRPSILVLYREDQKFILDNAIPKPGQAPSGYDLVIASQPYRARLPAEMKVKNVLKPLASSLAPGGRMIVIQSTGRDPGMEIIRGIWPDEAPFQVTRKTLINALKAELGDGQPDLKFDALSDDKSFFSYDLHAMPDELGQNIGTSTLMAAWNAAVYVAQIEDARLMNAMSSGDYMRATEKVLKEHDGLWFLDESFLISRDKKTRN